MSTVEAREAQMIITCEYAVEVATDSSGEFYGNALRFPTVDAAEWYAKDLYSRWTSVQKWRVVKYVPKGWELAKVVVEKAS